MYILKISILIYITTRTEECCTANPTVAVLIVLNLAYRKVKKKKRKKEKKTKETIKAATPKGDAD